MVSILSANPESAEQQEILGMHRELVESIIVVQELDHVRNCDGVCSKASVKVVRRLWPAVRRA